MDNKYKQKLLFFLTLLKDQNAIIFPLFFASFSQLYNIQRSPSLLLSTVQYIQIQIQFSSMLRALSKTQI
jgi:hypothetical protein